MSAANQNNPPNRTLSPVMRPTLLAVLAHPDDESFGLGGTLARYAHEGVDVHVGIATDGVAGSVAEGFEDTLNSLIEVRAREVEAAVNILGGTLHMLGFRDSGYIGDPANKHPEAFINVDETTAVDRVTALIEEIRPQVVITHDETGGYFHPDHIQCWKITTAAFFSLVGTEGGGKPDPAHSYLQRLYYSAFPNRVVRLYTTLMRLRGQDPTKMGRNKDIDFTNLGIAHDKLHARVDYRPYWETKRLASAQHPSQGGGTSNSRALPQWFQRRFLAKEYFMRAYPPADDGHFETDLFSGVDISL
jgi:mycothiol S-conjugate amidase